MRDCPKCGSYVPEGKVLCPACGRLTVGLSKDMRSRTMAEKRQTGARINAGVKEVKRSTPLLKQNNNPFAGGTYEQHKSHDPRSRDYYKSKHEPETELPNKTKRIFCAAAYFGFFFFIPLIAMPNSEEAKFHANQGLVLFLFNLILSGLAATASVTLSAAGTLGGAFGVLEILYPLLMIYGAANAYNGKMTELPLIGKIKILKNYE